jgi:hypothetical protein
VALLSSVIVHVHSECYRRPATVTVWVACRAGRGPKRSRGASSKADTQNGTKKMKQPKSGMAWEEAKGIELDQSSIADLCRAQECSNNIVISDVSERLRSGRMRIESSPVRHPLSLNCFIAARKPAFLFKFNPCGHRTVSSALSLQRFWHHYYCCINKLQCPGQN